MRYFLILAALAAQPALANDRTLTVTSFDRIRVEGSFQVEVVTGKGPSARITGSEQAIERTRVETQGQTVVIRNNTSAWGGWQGADAGPVVIRLTTPGLRAAFLSGASAVKIDRMRAPAVTVSMDGSGTLAIGSIDADSLDIGLAGAGTMKVAGKIAQARVTVRGSGIFDASALATTDLKLTADGSAEVKIAASRTANVVETGSGSVTVTGSPACTVQNRASGSVRCGAGASR